MTLEPVLLLLNAYAVAKIGILGAFVPFARSGPNVLILFIVPMVAALGYLIYVRVGDTAKERRGFWWIVATSFLLVMILATRQLAYRSNEILPLTDNDGAIQSREAARFLLHGVNPYQADYGTTPFRIFPSPVGEGVENLARTHYAYPPLQFLIMVPTVFINERFQTEFDTQIIYLFVFLLFTVVVVSLSPTWRLRTRLLVLTAGNAWLIYLILAGFNDIVFVTLLAAAAAFTVRKHPLLGAAMLGLAFVSKQTAWLTFPLWLAYWWYNRKQYSFPWWRPFTVTAVVAITIILPFVIWSPGAYFDDTIRYVSGAIPFTYPISGATLLQYLRVFGFISDPWAQFVSWPMQLVVWAGLSWGGWRAIRRDQATSNILTWSVIVIFGVLLVSRFAPDNYFLALVELAIAAYAIQLNERRELQETSHEE